MSELYACQNLISTRALLTNFTTRIFLNENQNMGCTQVMGGGVIAKNAKNNRDGSKIDQLLNC